MNPSPYVGPSPLNNEQVLFGRDAEIEELQWRLVADRIIVLYSPSGAGKTSLLTAKNGLLTQLSARFDAMPILRVGGKGGASAVAAILAQLQAAGKGEVKADDTLLSYFDRIPLPPTTPPKRLLWVIDQFEEIFSQALPLEEQRVFFQQAGELLLHAASPVWAIFSMREEYFSWLDAFRDGIPTRLGNTFRLNLLTTQQAVAAVKGPAIALGVEFPEENGEDAATHLVRELSKVRVRGPDGNVESRVGDRVEAVQLQVTCVDLWRRLSERGQEITEIRVSDISDYRPDSALEAYCGQALHTAVTKPERAGIVRDWIDLRLLSPSGLRTSAMVDPSEKFDPTSDEIAALEEVHLLRRQTREDGAWYELAHDSLTVPMRNSIEHWRDKHLPPWRRLARAWQLGGEQAAFFKTLPPLVLKNIPSANESDTYPEVENRFLADYQEYLRQKRRFRLHMAAIFAMVLVVVFLLFDRIKREARLVAERNVTALQAGVLAILGGNPSIGLRARAAVAGTELQSQNASAVAFNFRTALSDYLYQNRNIEAVEAEGDGISKETVVDRDYQVVAKIGNERFSVDVLNRTSGKIVWSINPVLLEKVHPHGVRSLALTGRGQLATGGSDGGIQIWDIVAKQPTGTTLRATGDKNAPLMHSAVRELTVDGALLYAGYERAVVAAWPLALPSPPDPVWSFKVQARVSGLAVADGGRSIAVADISGNEHVNLLHVADGRTKTTEFVAFPREQSYRGAFYSVAISPDGRYVAAGNRAGKIHIWDVAGKAHLLRIDAHDQAVAQLKYLGDGSLLSIGWDGRMKRWTRSDDPKLPMLGKTVLELRRQLVSVAVEPGERAALVTTEKGDVVKVGLPVNQHPFGRMLSGQGPFAYLVENGSHLKLLTVAKDALVTAVLNRDSTVSLEQTRTPLPGGVGSARADAINTTFVADGKHVVAYRDDRLSQDAAKVLDSDNITAIQVNGKGTLMIVQTADRTTLWSLRPSDLTATQCDKNSLPIRFPSGAVRLVAFRPASSDFIIIANGMTQYWRATERASACPNLEEAVQQLGDTRAEIQTAVFDTSGKLLWVGDFTGRLYSIALDSQEPKLTLIQDESITPPSALAVGANQTVAVGDSSGGIYVFQPGSAYPVKIAQDFHDSEIRSLALSADGHWLASSSNAGTAIWDLRIEKWIQRACALANNHSFNEADYNKYFNRVSEKPTPCAPTSPSQ